MNIEIWSDVVCPWCYVGKRRFESALSKFEHKTDVEVRWRSFELDPGAPALREGNPTQRLADKLSMPIEKVVAMEANLTSLAAAEGLDYHLDSVRSGNSFDAHRVIHLAADHGLQDAAKERLMRGYFTEGEAIGDRDTLVRLGAEVGLDASEISAMLASEQYADDVRLDEKQAAAYGISGVPFFVIDSKIGVSGAQPAEFLLSAMRQAWDDTAR